MTPALKAMSKTATGAATEPVKRLGCIYVPNGINQPMWVPQTVGAGFELSPILKPLAPFKNQLLVVSGLAHRQAEDLYGDGNNDHPRAIAVWLSGVHAYNRPGHPVQLGTTFDQVVAQQIGKTTRLPSLELVLENPSQIACAGGDCFYGSTLSWRNPTTPNPMEGHPRVVFNRLFGDGGSSVQRLARMKQTDSILDSVSKELASLMTKLGAGDKSKLDQYTDSVRDIELRIQNAERQSAEGESDLALPERPTDIPEKFEDHAKLMFDLQVLAFQADLTRVFTLMIGQEGSSRTYPQIGVPEQHHPISHHRERPEFLMKKAKIDTYHVELLGYFLDKLRNTPDGDGSLLDHSMILYGGGLGNGNFHDHKNMPCLVAGGVGGNLKGDRHLKYPEYTPMTNLMLSLMDKLGIPVPEKIGDSTEHLQDI